MNDLETLSIKAALQAAYDNGKADGIKEGLAQQCRISIPTETMEQEFAIHYRKGKADGIREERERCEAIARAMFNRAATGDEIADAIRSAKEKL